MANSNTDSRANLQKAFDKSKALFFLDITPPNKIEPKTKVIAYIPNYIADVEDSKNALVTAKILPYREKFAEGPENVVRRFRNKELQFYAPFGKNPLTSQGASDAEKNNPFPKFPNGVVLRFFILPNGNTYGTGTIVGVAEVAEASPDKQATGPFYTIPIYHVDTPVQKVFQGVKDVDCRIQYVATSGTAPVRNADG